HRCDEFHCAGGHYQRSGAVLCSPIPVYEAEKHWPVDKSVGCSLPDDSSSAVSQCVFNELHTGAHGSGEQRSDGYRRRWQQQLFHERISFYQQRGPLLAEFGEHGGLQWEGVARGDDINWRVGWHERKRICQ